MGQNVFQKMAEFFKKSTDNSVKPVDNSVKFTNFWVLKFSYSFYDSTSVQPIFFNFY
jgi:hypothetical protein